MLRGGRRRFGRRDEQLNTGARFIIACEGSKTEVQFFHGIRKELRLSTLQMDILHAGVTNPRGIVEAAIERRANITDWRREADTAWAVYDGVEHFRNNPNDWHEARDLAMAKKISLAISNPSFEFWYLLHFQDQTAWIERDVAVRLLRDNHIPDYDKANCYYPNPLGKLTGAAIDRANKLVLQAERNGQELPHCLCAEGVVNLVGELLRLR